MRGGVRVVSEDVGLEGGREGERVPGTLTNERRGEERRR